MVVRELWDKGFWVENLFFNSFLLKKKTLNKYYENLPKYPTNLKISKKIKIDHDLKTKTERGLSGIVAVTALPIFFSFC